MVSQLRSNNTVFKLPEPHLKKAPGRPRKYGKKLGDAASLAFRYKPLASEYRVSLYGRIRTVVAYDRVVMLKTLKCSVRLVWVYRKTKWVALFSTDLTLSVQQVIEYYGARWKIEAAFKELKQDVGSVETHTRLPNAVINHLHFCMIGFRSPGFTPADLRKRQSGGTRLKAVTISPFPMFEDRLLEPHWMIIVVYFSRCHANPS